MLRPEWCQKWCQLASTLAGFLHETHDLLGAAPRERQPGAAVAVAVDDVTHPLDPRAAAAALGARRPAPRLSDQELRVLELAAQGCTNREIGTRLYLSRHTVKEYLSNAMRKLEVDSRVEAVVEASRRGLLEAPALPRAS